MPQASPGTGGARYPRTLVGQQERTFIICKPDAVERGLAGEIIARFERRGLRMVRAELRTIDKETAATHYGEHAGKPFYDGLISYITAGPSLLAVLEGPEGTWKIVRDMMGATDPAKSAPGTIRGDYAVSMDANVIHGSDGPESAAREIGLFFPGVQPSGL
jgi:nucleoside-diphosphate kinase